MANTVELQREHAAHPAVAPARCRPVLVDGHVHLHRCFDLGEALDAAARNVHAGASQSNMTGCPFGCLLLAECAGVNRFNELRDRIGKPGPGRWTLHTTEEPCALIARRDDAPALAVVAGRQIACREGLEVLALVTDRGFPDGRPIRETLDAVIDARALPVLPWGFGKWWFRRGALMTDLVHAWRGGTFLLGDNGGRPAAYPRPRLFAAARDRGIRVLPGSDPLPFRSQIRRVGRYGCAFECALDERRPAAEAHRLLTRERAPLRVYGRREGPRAFLVNQVRMQLRRRRGEPWAEQRL